jgi:hypothetical protein
VARRIFADDRNDQPRNDPALAQARGPRRDFASQLQRERASIQYVSRHRPARSFG